MSAVRAMRLCAVVMVLSLVCDRPVSAAIVSGFSGTTIPIPAVNYFGAGPQAVAPGITWSSTNVSYQSGAVFGYTGTYGFGGNGLWDGAMGAMIGTNSPTDSMTLSLSTPVTAIGGFVNYAPGSGSDAVISVYDSSYTLIESTTLTFVTGSNNDGQFIGFQEATPMISYMTLSGSFIGLTGLKVAAVPEPSTVALTLTGAALAGMMGIRRRRKLQAK